MRSQKTPGRWLAPIVLAGTLLGFGCGGGNGVMISVKIIYSEAGTDGQGPSDGAAAEVPVGRCCVLAVPDASASDNCATLARHFLGVSEPCLPARDGGGSMYGQWTCGAAATAAQCTDDGLSCALGDPCTMPDVGCQGVVAACGFTAADGGAPRG
ncbi:MAG TPA: hypothetical protein VKZ18_21670 [Polyangia bacterium]|nr:hypothetical protein [Polyangia bacterium]